MFNVKAENLLENYTWGALMRCSAGNEGSWLLLAVFTSQDRLLYKMLIPNSQISRQEPRTSTPQKVCSSLTLGESLNISLPGFTRL